MITVMRHDNNSPSYFQKGLSDWWNEESEYFIQRIEKWAGISRGYNRLKSTKSFDNDDDNNDGEDCSRRWKNFNSLKKSQRRKSHTTEEKTKINCCGTFKYQSNNNFDNTCLETYRYDHSIYFKTIGDIKNHKNEVNKKKAKCFNDDEKVEWDIRMNTNYPTDKTSSSSSSVCYFENKNNWNCYNQSYVRTVWPNINEFIEDAGNDDNYINDIENNNNNYINNNNFHNNGNYYVKNINQNKMDNIITESSNSRNTKLNNLDKNLTKFFKLRRASSSKSSKSGEKKSSSVIYGDNNVSWPSVLLNYTKNMDPELSTAHRRRAFNVQLNH